MVTHYFHIVTPLDITETLPILINENLEIVRMTGNIREHIQRIIPLFAGIGPVVFANPYENKFERNDTDKQANPGYIRIKLEENEMRYYAVKVTNGKYSRSILDYSLSLLESGLDLGVALIQQDDRIGYSAEFGASFFSPDRFNPLHCRLLTCNDINEIREIINKVMDNDSTNIQRAMEMYFLSQHISRSNDVKVLLLFTAIEAILTHQPQTKDLYDTLTHQITTKLKLLTPRFSTRIDSPVYFGSVSHEKLWKKLYGLRSSIAHGSRPDFSSSEFRALENWGTVLTYLYLIVKTLIKHSMDERDLVVALRDC